MKPLRRREQIDVTYAALAQLLGGRSDEVALFDNSTHAWNAAFYSIPLGPGDRISPLRSDASPALESGLDAIGDPPASSVSGCGRTSDSSRA